jgi:hypothetical protein
VSFGNRKKKRRRKNMKLSDLIPVIQWQSRGGQNNGKKPEQQTPTYTLTSYSELQANPPQEPAWLVDRLFPEGGISIIGGDGGVGKSFLGLLLGISVASGKEFLGEFGVKQGQVLIIDEENALTLTYERLQKLTKGLQSVDPNLPLSFLSNQGVLLDNDDSYNALKSELEKLKPSLIIVDSLVRVHGADENSAKEMEGVFRRAKELAKLHNSTIIFLHHTRKLSQNFNWASQMLRGSSDIRNFVDSYVYMWAKGNEKTLVHDKSRYAEAVEAFKVLVEDSKDPDGNDMMTIKYTGKAKPPKKSKLDEAKDIIVELLEKNGKMTRPAIRSAVNSKIGSTTMDKALEELKRQGIIDWSGGNGRIKYYWLVNP